MSELMDFIIEFIVCFLVMFMTACFGHRKLENSKNPKLIFAILVKTEKKNHLPNKVLAVRTKCWLFKESGNETMVLDVKDVLLF